MKYTMLVERTRTGWCALSQPWGALTTAKDMTELRTRIVELMNFAMEEQGEVVTWDDIILKYYKPFRVRRVAGKRA